MSPAADGGAVIEEIILQAMPRAIGLGEDPGRDDADRVRRQQMRFKNGEDSGGLLFIPEGV